MKMQVKEEQYAVGVIVGRFQVPELHDAHRALIQHVLDAHGKVIVFLGLSPLKVTRENPLDYEARKQMLVQAFPELDVHYIKDVANDTLWSNRLDAMIRDLTTPAQSVVLYGGRDSFIDHYHGQYQTRELEQDVWISGTEIRHAVSQRSVKATSDFRAGVVWATSAQFPSIKATVDVAIFSMDEQKILLGRKPNENAFRFIGGFSEPRARSFEEDARREVTEEAGIEISDPVYLCSSNIRDWRYRAEQDQIRTLFFVAKHRFGRPKPGDDIAEVRWVELDTLTLDQVVPEHRGLLSILLSERNNLRFR